jgi:hypothetical protein
MMLRNSMPAVGSILRNHTRAPRTLWTDLLVVAVLVGLGIVARLIPHAPNFTPVAASALFAASVLRVRALSLLVPLLAMLLGDAVLGFYDWRVMAIVYGALALPACAACLSSRLRGSRALVPVMLSSSLAFFLITNFAVWAFSSLYAPDASGLIACYVAALPFLKYTIAGDLVWAGALFGSFWLLQNIVASARVVNAEAVMVRARSR